MTGNVQEWCHDASSIDAYAKLAGGPVVDPTGLDNAGADHIVRGGAWSEGAMLMRSSARPLAPPAFQNVNLGFRVAISVDAARRVLASAAKAPVAP